MTYTTKPPAETPPQIELFRGIHLDRLSEVFDLVKHRSNWKYAIDRMVSKSAATREEIEAAVIFYAGGVPTVTEYGPTGAYWHVTGAGYYTWIGA